MNSGQPEPVEAILSAVQRRYPALDIGTFQRGPFKQWRDGALFSRPIQRPGRGKTRGKGAIYPPGTTAQVLRILAMRDEAGRFRIEQARWRLWWERYPVDPEPIRARLASDLAAWDALFGSWRSQPDGERRAMLASLTSDDLPDPLRAVRDVIGPASFAHFAAVLVRLAAGTFSDWEHDKQPAAFLAGLGLDRAAWLLRSFGRHDLQELAAGLRPDALRAALEQATDADLCDARDEVQAVFGFLATVRRMADDILTMGGTFNVATLGLSRLPDPNELDHTFTPILVCVWLSWRRQPNIAAGYETLMQSAQELAAKVGSVLDLFHPETDEQTRRWLPPSRVAAQEVGFPCTMSLALPPPRSAMVS